MLLSDEDKRQIRRELAQGKINSSWEVPPVHPENDQDGNTALLAFGCTAY